MLNGIDPIIIFEFSKNVSEKAAASVSEIPIVSAIVKKIGLPPIPIYLSEKLTGLYIDSEDRAIDIETNIQTTVDGSSPSVGQRAINNVTRVNLTASRNSIGLTLLSALADLVVPKVTSKEYSITYLHGAITIFRGLLHGFSTSQNSENDLIQITLELTKNDEAKKTGPPEVQARPDAATLEGGIQGPLPTAPTGTSGAIKGPLPSVPPTAAPVQLNGLG